MIGTVTRVLVLLVGAAALAGSYVSVDAKRITKAQLHAKQADAAARIRANVPRAATPNKGTGVKNITFTNPRASGTSLRVYLLRLLYVELERVRRVLCRWDYDSGRKLGCWA